MKTLVLSLSFFLSVLFIQTQAQSTVYSVTATTYCQVTGSTAQVSLSTINQNIPGFLHYTFQIFFGDGSYAVSNEPYYSNDTTFSATHTYTSNGTYNITYILGYANEQNDGPDGLELSQTLRTITVSPVPEPTGLMPVNPNQPTDIYNNNKQLTIKSLADVTNVQLFDMAGQEVQNITPETSGTINLTLADSLAPGVYIVSVKNSDNTTVTKKIVLN